MRLLRSIPVPSLLAILLLAGPGLAQTPASASPPGPSSAQAPSFDPAAVDRLAEATLKRWGLAGLALAVVDHDRVVVLRGYGTRGLSGGGAVGPDTLFQIGSTTKAFTTTLLALLVDEKKLRWDDPVRDHLESFRLSDPCADALVTLRDLVSHRTGLAEHDELWDDSPWGRQEVIRRAAFLPLARPFRSRYGYNNIMLMAAGEAAASAAALPWETLVRTRILAPLGMASTRLTDAEWLAAKDRAEGLKLTEDGRVVPQVLVGNEPLGPAGTVKSTARDLAQWVRFHLAGGTVDGQRLVSAEALDETKMPQTVLRFEGTTRANNPETNLMSYGMAWVVQDHRGELLVGHSGSLNGFRARIDLLPKRQVGFVLLTNTGRAPALVALRNGLVDLLLDGKESRDWNAYYLDLEAKGKARSEARKREAEASRPKGTAPSHDVPAYAGAYANRSHGTMTVTAEDGKLVLTWNRMKGPLVHQVFDAFLWRVGEPDNLEETVQFTLDARGSIEALKVFDLVMARAPETKR